MQLLALCSCHSILRPTIHIFQTYNVVIGNPSTHNFFLFTHEKDNLTRFESHMFVCKCFRNTCYGSFANLFTLSLYLMLPCFSNWCDWEIYKDFEVMESLCASDRCVVRRRVLLEFGSVETPTHNLLCLPVFVLNCLYSNSVLTIFSRSHKASVHLMELAPRCCPGFLVHTQQLVTIWCSIIKEQKKKKSSL